MLTVQLHVDMATAYATLRSHAAAAERPVRDVASDVIAHILHLAAAPA
jgi:hypothetical protein